MEKLSDYEPIELPPGFRFHPSDEELITHYLCPKVVDSSLTTKAIGEVDLNKVEPWDLPWKAKMGEKEWYFFCVKDRKYPTGLRTNRATEAGYWKATGKDKEIFRAKILVGMKKTLVFYRGRAPTGEKTNWVMHEYRLEGKNFMNNISKDTRNEWVICRIFKKSSGGKKVHISGLLRNTDIVGNHSQTGDLPPLMDLSSDENRARTNGSNVTSTNGSNVTCFSNPTEHPQDKPRDAFTSSSSRNRDFSQTPFNLQKISAQNPNFSPQIIPGKENTSNPDPLLMQDQSMLRFLMENSFSNMKQSFKAGDISSALSFQEMGFKPYDDHEFQVNSAVPVDLDCLWNY